MCATGNGGQDGLTDLDEVVLCIDTDCKYGEKCVLQSMLAEG